jgi:hypothetical protein
VVSGQFLLDSEASLRTGLPRLEGSAPADEHAGHASSGAKEPGANDPHAEHRAPAPERERAEHAGHN